MSLYVPPHIKRQQQALALANGLSEAPELDDTTRQRDSWEVLRKGINGTVNRVNVKNIKDLVAGLFRYIFSSSPNTHQTRVLLLLTQHHFHFHFHSHNLLRAPGLLCTALLNASATSPTFTPVYASLLSVLNTKLPALGSLLLSRLVLQFRDSYRSKNKNKALGQVRFIAQLVNFGIAHELLALQVIDYCVCYCVCLFSFFTSTNIHFHFHFH